MTQAKSDSDAGGLWDLARQTLDVVLESLTASPRLFDRRQLVALMFVDRVERRNQALTSLFREGLYIEALPVVRSGFEDWVNLAYMMSDSSDGRLEEYVDDSLKLHAALYDALVRLSGPEAADHEFPDLPHEVRTLVDGGPAGFKIRRNMRDRATIVGLGEVYEFAYRYLSELAHGNLRALLACAKVDGRVYQPATPQRDWEEEQTWALWAWWFHLRTLTVAGRCLGEELEMLSDGVLEKARSIPFSPSDMLVMQREKA